MLYDIYGDPFDPATQTGNAYDASGNFVGNYADGNTAASTYTSLTAPASTSSTANVITSTLTGLTGLANSAANIYRTATGGTVAAPAKIVNGKQVAATTSPMSTQTILILVVVAVLGAALFLMRRGK